MKKTILLFTCLLFIYSNLFAQKYDLFNDIFDEIDDTIFISASFEPWDSKILELIETKDIFKNNWEPLPSNRIPDIETFLKNFNSKDALKRFKIENESNQLIEFNKLSNKIIKVNNTKDHLKSGNNYLVLTKPIFNEDNTWALSYIYGVYHMDVGNAGYIKIYRKLRGKWIYYHKLMIWIS